MNTEALGIATLAFLFALGAQSVIQMQEMNKAVKRYWWIKDNNEAAKLIRRDVSGIIIAISITNALLTAILATLLFRS